MTIEAIARTVLDSFEDSDVVLAIIDKDGNYVSSDIETFEEVFSQPEMLERVCQRIDDGCEPLVFRMGDYLMAASSVNTSSYSILLVPNYSLEKKAAYNDFVEIILNQIAILAEKSKSDSQTIQAYNPELLAGIPLN